MLAQKATFYQILEYAGEDRCAFVDTASLMDLVDSILIFISAQESLQEFSVADIMTQQGGEIKQIYNKDAIIEFGL